MTSSSNKLPAARRWAGGAFVAGALGLAACGWAAADETRDVLVAWLTALLAVWEVAVGCLMLLALPHLIRGNWGRAVRPALTAGAGLWLLTAAAFVPLAMNIETVYPWAGSEAADDPLLQHKAPYLNEDAFLIRAGVYFASWAVAWLLLSALAPAPAAHGEPSRLIPRRAAFCLILLVLTISFAAIDWGMSLEPHWFSAMYGALYVAGGGLSAMALATIAVTAFGANLPVARLSDRKLRNDLGTLLLAFLMVWAYFAFSQFIIIWSGNLPEENVWYLARARSGWQYWAIAVVAVHFVVPFFLLLSTDVKQNPGALTVVALLILLGRVLQLVWMIAPPFYPRVADVPWQMPAALLGVGGVWTGCWLLQLERNRKNLLKS